MHGRKLSRTSGPRKALLKTLLVSLVSHRRITTTLAKAKELKSLAERTVTHAKKGLDDSSVKVAKIRLLQGTLPKETVSDAFKIAEKFKSRNGGYTRIIKLGARKSDTTPMAIIEFVEPANVIEKVAKSEKGKKVKAGKTATKASSPAKPAKAEEKDSK